MPFSTAQPNIARMYDYWLQGKDHYPADRAAALAVMEKFPEVATIAQANRAFLVRAVRHVARQGVTQFIDFGAGLPTSPNTHEVAREIAPDARVCYVDNDQLVLAHARAMLEVDDHVSVTAGDLRAPGAALADPAIASLIDATMPTCVLMVSVLHFLTAGRGRCSGGRGAALAGSRQLPGDLGGHVHRHRPGTDQVAPGRLRRDGTSVRPDRGGDRGLVRRVHPGPARTDRRLGLAAQRPTARVLHRARRGRDSWRAWGVRLPGPLAGWHDSRTCAVRPAQRAR